MFTDPLTLIDETISNLESLRAVFADEFDERIHNDVLPTRSERLSRDAHRRIAALIPSLKAAREIQQAASMRCAPPICLDCD